MERESDLKRTSIVLSAESRQKAEFLGNAERRSLNNLLRVLLDREYERVLLERAANGKTARTCDCEKAQAE
jgi:hypothetical protein